MHKVPTHQANQNSLIFSWFCCTQKLISGTKPSWFWWKPILYVPPKCKRKVLKQEEEIWTQNFKLLNIPSEKSNFSILPGQGKSYLWWLWQWWQQWQQWLRWGCFSHKTNWVAQPHNSTMKTQVHTESAISLLSQYKGCVVTRLLSHNQILFSLFFVSAFMSLAVSKEGTSPTPCLQNNTNKSFDHLAPFPLIWNVFFL